MYDVESDSCDQVDSVDASVRRTTVSLDAEDGAINKDKPRRYTATEEETSTTKSGTGRSKCGACVRGCLTFLFSTVGLTCLLVGYCIVGALVFMELEADQPDSTTNSMVDWMELEADVENRTAEEMERVRREHVELLWNMTMRMNILYPDAWKTGADQILKNYTTIVRQNYTTFVYRNNKLRGWDAASAVQNGENQWSFAGSLLYAITVITTIGIRTHQCSYQHPVSVQFLTARRYASAGISCRRVCVCLSSK